MIRTVCEPILEHKQKSTKTARFAAAQAEWTSAKKAGRIYTVVQAMKEKLQSRGSNVESQKSKFRSFFSAKNPADAGMYSHDSVYNRPPRLGYFKIANFLT